MRTTLTLDDDVVARLEALRAGRGTLKQLINDTLRTGLDQMDQSREQEHPYRLLTFRLGRRVPDLDNIAEVLASSEAEDWR